MSSRGVMTRVVEILKRQGGGLTRPPHLKEKVWYCIYRHLPPSKVVDFLNFSLKVEDRGASLEHVLVGTFFDFAVLSARDRTAWGAGHGL
jgi:hypothetical protein